jgi:hypothetical protein
MDAGAGEPLRSPVSALSADRKIYLKTDDTIHSLGIPKWMKFEQELPIFWAKVFAKS